MKKTLLAAAALTLIVASPALAQSFDPDIGSGNITPYNDNMNRPRPNPDLNVATPYNAHDDWYAQAPGTYHGHRSPYATFDSNGHVVQENPPDRW